MGTSELKPNAPVYLAGGAGIEDIGSVGTACSVNSIESLAQNPSGLFRPPVDSYPNVDAPQIAITQVRGDFSHLNMPDGVHHAVRVHGGGIGLTHTEAHVSAIAEALERYCTSVYCDDQFIVASGDELDGQCLDLDTIPRCSDIEIANPRCPLIRPAKNKPIRWIKGVSLIDRKAMYVPAVMVFAPLFDISPGERFWFPISTGCAAHFDVDKALFNAVCEVIERDAISLTWLRRFRLPRVVIDYVPDELAPYWERYLKSSSAVEFEFYDATTDLGVPTIYGLRIAKNSEHAHTLVACSTGASTVEAIKKVLCDLASISTFFEEPKQHPASFDQFREMLHGASYMAQASQKDAFNFLRSNGRVVSLRSIVQERKTVWNLDALLQCLGDRGMSVFALDLTTDEAEQAGVKVVRAVIPELQPLSFHYLARFLGHLRLYNAVLPCGDTMSTEDEVNPLPQPFA
jgi:ribosomal protein S12 methylthiotransferase accessory factor